MNNIETLETINKLAMKAMFVMETIGVNVELEKSSIVDFIENEDDDVMYLFEVVSDIEKNLNNLTESVRDDMVEDGISLEDHTIWAEKLKYDPRSFQYLDEPIGTMYELLDSYTCEAMRSYRMLTECRPEDVECPDV